MPSLNFTTDEDPLSLSQIRSVLVRLEDTIIFSLIERAQFAHNPIIYQSGAFKELSDLGFRGSWLEWFLNETESFHAKARRYTSPDEYPFTSNLPEPVIPPLHFPNILHPNNINANQSILSFYINAIVPRITPKRSHSNNSSSSSSNDDDDGNYGSAATLDVEVLQSISKRVHYGKFVSESKFRQNPSAFIPHIRQRNRKALEELITKPEIEHQLLIRLQKKAETYGQDIGADSGERREAVAAATATVTAPNGVNGKVHRKIDPDGVVDLYESYIIPLTKEVEVDYLLNRLEGLAKEEIEQLSHP